MTHRVIRFKFLNAAFFVMAVAACGTGPSNDLPIGHLTISPAAPIDFGLSPCGAPSPALPVTLANDETSSPIHWTATADGPFVIDGPSTGALTSHTTTNLALRAAVPPSAIAAVPIVGTLRIDSDDPARPSVTVPLLAVAQGAMLRLPSFPIELGDVPVSATSFVVAANLVNDGNAPAAITFGAPSDPQFTVESKGFQLPPGANGDVALQFTPTVAGDANATVPLIVAGPVCGAQGPLSLHGKGTKGIVLASPGSLDFGLVDCGEGAGSKSVLVKNVGDLAFSLNASLAIAANFTVTPSAGTVFPGQTVAVFVKPNPVPSVSAVTPDLYGDTLTITTTALDDVPHIIPIHETARGMILSLSAPQTIRGLVDDVTNVPATLYNSGNVVVNDAKLVTVDNVLSTAPTTLGPNSSASVMLEVRSDPQKLGILQTPFFPGFQTTSSVANCGGPVTVPTVTAYDYALDFSTNGSNYQCVLGHTKRVYCSAVSPPYALVYGATADELSASWGPWLRSGLSLERSTQPKSYYVLPSTWLKLIKPTDTAHWCATEANGDLWCVGENGGQWGNGQHGVQTFSPVSAFPTIRPISDYAASYDFGYVVHSGEVWASGADVLGSLGNPSVLNGSTYDPVQVLGLSDAVRVSAGRQGGCALRATGVISCWGEGDPGQRQVPWISNAVDLVADGPSRGCAILGGGGIKCWDGQTPNILPLSNVKKLVSSTWGLFYAIEAGNQLSWFYAWGQPQRVVGFDGP